MDGQAMSIRCTVPMKAFVERAKRRKKRAKGEVRRRGEEESTGLARRSLSPAFVLQSDTQS